MTISGADARRSDEINNFISLELRSLLVGIFCVVIGAAIDRPLSLHWLILLDAGITTWVEFWCKPRDHFATQVFSRRNMAVRRLHRFKMRQSKNLQPSSKNVAAQKLSACESVAA